MGIGRKIDELNIDTICVVCTEAVRAAYTADRGSVDAFLCSAAEILGIPRQAINIISMDMEALMGGLALLRAHPSADGYVFIMGGNSFECLEISNGRIENSITLRIGTNSLQIAPENLDKIVTENLGKIPWLKGKPGRTAYFIGGPFRPVGRDLAQTLYRTRYDSVQPFNGHGFECGDELENALQKLSKASWTDLCANFLRMEYPDAHRLNNKEANAWRNMSAEEIMSGLREREFIQWARSRAYREKYAKWTKRIGRRASTVSLAATFVCHAKAYTNPISINFSAQNMRDGALSFGLLRPDDLKRLFVPSVQAPTPRS